MPSLFAGCTPADLAKASHHDELAAYLSRVGSAYTAVPSKTSFPQNPSELQPDKVQSGQTGNKSHDVAADLDAHAIVHPAKHKSIDTRDGQAVARNAVTRGFEGYGTPGTRPRFNVLGFRVLAVMTQVSDAAGECVVGRLGLLCVALLKNAQLDHSQAIAAAVHYNMGSGHGNGGLGVAAAPAAAACGCN